ncbi:12037_t:CDS:2, partial [Gigaspora margarita]
LELFLQDSVVNINILYNKADENKLKYTEIKDGINDNIDKSSSLLKFRIFEKIRSIHYYYTSE